MAKGTAKKVKVVLNDDQKAAKAAEKASKFTTIGAKRMSSALKAIQLLGNLSSRGSYSYTDEQVEKMRGALVAQVGETFLRFKTTGGAEKPTFSF